MKTSKKWITYFPENATQPFLNACAGIATQSCHRRWKHRLLLTVFQRGCWEKSLNNERHSREPQHSLLPEQSENPLFLGGGELKRCTCIFSCVSGIVMVITAGRLSPKWGKKYAREEMREEEVKMKLAPSAKLRRRAEGAACCCRELSGLSDCGFWWINLQLMWSPRRTCRTDGAELLEPVHWSRPAKQTGGAHTQVGGQDGSTGVGIDAALGLPCIRANFRFTSIKKKSFLNSSFVLNLSVK